MWQTGSQLDQQKIRKRSKAVGFIKTLLQEDIWPQGVFQMLKKIWSVKISILSVPAKTVTFQHQPLSLPAEDFLAVTLAGACLPSLKWPIIFSPVWLQNWHWKWVFLPTRKDIFNCFLCAKNLKEWVMEVIDLFPALPRCGGTDGHRCWGVTPPPPALAQRAEWIRPAGEHDLMAADIHNI